MKKELKTKLTQERIIDAALIEFSQKGYKAFGINELCKNHKISKGILYQPKTDLDGNIPDSYLSRPALPVFLGE